MATANWFLLIGLLMLTRGVAAAAFERLPFTPAIIYLAVGFTLGPSVMNVFYLDPLQQSKTLELLTEIAVLISLFSAGVKMPVPVKLSRWRPALLLAWLSMTVTVGLVAAFGHLVLGLPLGAAILLGGLLAPTDPVLATDVQSRHPGDNDQLRSTLTCEAGLNDGTAFPFVMLGLGLLGLHEIGDFGWKWVAKDVLWATFGAIVIGAFSGGLIGYIVWKLRGEERKHDVLDDLVGLGLIGIVYGTCVLLDTWGFLAVFFAAVGLRQTELTLARRAGVKPEKLNADTAEPVEIASDEEEPPPIVSAQALVFKEHLERLSELMLVLLLGGMMFLDFWNWRTVGLALFLFFIARPLSVFIGLAPSDTTWRVRGIAGWFGVRGIGSVYYLMYAIQHGLSPEVARELVPMTLVVITLSILMHGTSVKPLLNRLWRPRPQSA
ncbi:sodium/proton antiporter, CPA1 family [Noviherbaspirillum humi]|uniref:Sodium/proton antiporter, CPA1 family n=1 Tax=Noviherbaspirillum humi TaxID=1688639 RepID=A0A239HEL2_9BURK|nr:cation:proton antiporter [Noviherbaspirillum humi]SNS79732.1 sodium/proton antiporter, CPA1 family [Noviherbaspirillum humi]